MANTRTKFGESGETLRPGDTDDDLRGTYPGSTSVPTEFPGESVGVANIRSPKAPTPSRHSRPHTTADQWRDYAHTDLVVPESSPITGPARHAAQLALDFIRQGVSSDQPSGPQHGTLLDPSGRAVLGSRGFTPEMIADYKIDNPGSIIKGIDKEPPSSPVAE